MVMVHCSIVSLGQQISYDIRSHLPPNAIKLPRGSAYLFSPNPCMTAH